MNEEDEAFNEIERRAKQRMEAVKVAVHTPAEDYRAMYLKVRDELAELQQRTWVGLNKEEAFELQVKHKDKPFSLSAAVENLLREKN